MKCILHFGFFNNNLGKQPCKYKHDKNICVLFGEQQVCKNFESRRNFSAKILKEGSKIHQVIGKVGTIYEDSKSCPNIQCRHICDNDKNFIYHMHESQHRPYVLPLNQSYFKLSLKNSVLESMYRL